MSVGWHSVLFSIRVFSDVFSEDTLFENRGTEGKGGEKKNKECRLDMLWRETVHFVMVKVAILNACETAKFKDRNPAWGLRAAEK